MLLEEAPEPSKTSRNVVELASLMLLERIKLDTDLVS